MNNNNVVFIVAAICVLVVGGFVYTTSDSFRNGRVHISSDQELAFKQFILDNPELIEEALNNLNQKRREFANNKRADYLKENYDDIVKNTKAPRVGAVKPKHYILEFFDYNCGWCKKMMPMKDRILKENKDIQLIFMELPILGDYSVLATRAALAVYIAEPKKYLDFHRALLVHKGSIKSQSVIDSALEKAKIDLSKYNKAKSSPEIDDMISEIRDLAINLGVMGTPAYIINGQLVPGAFQYEDLEKLLKK